MTTTYVILTDVCNSAFYLYHTGTNKKISVLYLNCSIMPMTSKPPSTLLLNMSRVAPHHA